MSTAPIKQILSTPITLLRPADKEESGVFGDKPNGWLYALGLSSGQSFIVRLDKNKDVFTLRPKNNLLPHLEQIEWQQNEAFGDLGYHTICQTTPDASEEEKTLYKEALSPIPDDRHHPLTKVAFKHYLYPPILERMIELKAALKTCENLQQILSKAQKKLHGLQRTGNNDMTKTITQNKLNERRQNG